MGLYGHVTVSEAVELSSQLHQEDLLPGRPEDSLRPKRLTRRTTPSSHSPLDRERSSEIEPAPVRRVGSDTWVTNCDNLCVPGPHSQG